MVGGPIYHQYRADGMRFPHHKPQPRWVAHPEMQRYHQAKTQFDAGKGLIAGVCAIYYTISFEIYCLVLLADADHLHFYLVYFQISVVILKSHPCQVYCRSCIPEPS
jgi:hypothetical protein